MEFYRPYHLRLESQSMFRDPKDELLPDEVHDDAELSSLIGEAAHQYLVFEIWLVRRLNMIFNTAQQFIAQLSHKL